jgi:hypothetical protein
MSILAPHSPQATRLQNADRQERTVWITETGLEIGRGTRARIMEILLDGEPMARKEYGMNNGALRAMQGHRILQLNLPKTEVATLVPIELDVIHNAIVMPKLNEHAWVVSMGGNQSADRQTLQAAKLPQIPNFNDVVAQLMNAVQDCGDRGLEMGPDVYFLKVDRETHQLSYVYADTESVHTQPTEDIHNVPLRNLYWAAGALHLFLRECTEQPDPYLVRVRQEALQRMNGYGLPTRYWQEALMNDHEFTWPSSTMGQKISWLMELAKRQVVESWKS